MRDSWVSIDLYQIVTIARTRRVWNYDSIEFRTTIMVDNNAEGSSNIDWKYGSEDHKNIDNLFYLFMRILHWCSLLDHKNHDTNLIEIRILYPVQWK